MDDMILFAPLTKIDAAQRLVYGIVAVEAPDVSGTILCRWGADSPSRAPIHRLFRSSKRPGA